MGNTENSSGSTSTLEAPISVANPRRTRVDADGRPVAATSPVPENA